MKTKLALLGSFLVLGLAAGCGSDDEEEPAQQPAQEPKQEAPAAEGAAVSMKDITFKPDAINVKKGEAVTWTNDDSVGHDVTKKGGPGAEFKSGDPGGMQAGDTFKQTFTTAGKVDYVCTVHPNMTGTVTVGR